LGAARPSAPVRRPERAAAAPAAARRDRRRRPRHRRPAHAAPRRPAAAGATALGRALIPFPRLILTASSPAHRMETLDKKLKNLIKAHRKTGSITLSQLNAVLPDDIASSPEKLEAA